MLLLVSGVLLVTLQLATVPTAVAQGGHQYVKIEGTGSAELWVENPIFPTESLWDWDVGTNEWHRVTWGVVCEALPNGCGSYMVLDLRFVGDPYVSTGDWATGPHSIDDRRLRTNGKRWCAWSCVGPFCVQNGPGDPGPAEWYAEGCYLPNSTVSPPWMQELNGQFILLNLDDGGES